MKTQFFSVSHILPGGQCRPAALPCLHLMTHRVASFRKSLTQSVTYDFNVSKVHIHGRHMDVDEDLRAMVIGRLKAIDREMTSAVFIEAEGGIEHADVRLMASSCTIRLFPAHMNRSMHSPFLRHGQLQALSVNATNARDAFEQAATHLERKLKPWCKPPVRKVSYKNAFGERNH